MPTPIEIGLLAVIISVAIPALAAYGKLRDEMATFRAELVALRVEDARNASDIKDEAHRNDMQDSSISQILQTLARIDANVQRLVNMETVGKNRATDQPGRPPN